jgi:hypothetical protein
MRMDKNKQEIKQGMLRVDLYNPSTKEVTLPLRSINFFNDRGFSRANAVNVDRGLALQEEVTARQKKMVSRVNLYKPLYTTAKLSTLEDVNAFVASFSGDSPSEFGLRLREISIMLHSQPHNVELFMSVASMLQALAYKMAAEGVSESRVVRISRSAHESGGVNEFNITGLFPQIFAPIAFKSDVPPLFVLKGGDAYQIRTYALAGLLALNALRAEIPNFEFVYGIYSAHGGVKSEFFNRDTATIFDTSAPYAEYLMVETISNAIKLNEIDADDMSAAEFNAVIIQVILALQRAKEFRGFCHNSLTADKIYVQKLNRRQTISYFIEEREFRIETQYIARITDFRFSRAQVTFDLGTGEEYMMHTGLNDVWLGIQSWRASSLPDMITLFASIMNGQLSDDERGEDGGKTFISRLFSGEPENTQKGMSVRTWIDALHLRDALAQIISEDFIPIQADIKLGELVVAAWNALPSHARPLMQIFSAYDAAAAAVPASSPLLRCESCTVPSSPTQTVKYSEIGRLRPRASPSTDIYADEYAKLSHDVEDARERGRAEVYNSLLARVVEMQKREAFLGPVAPLPEMRSTAEMIEILSGAQ